MYPPVFLYAQCVIHTTECKENAIMKKTDIRKLAAAAMLVAVVHSCRRIQMFPCAASCKRHRGRVLRAVVCSRCGVLHKPYPQSIRNRFASCLSGQYVRRALMRLAVPLSKKAAVRLYRGIIRNVCYWRFVVLPGGAVSDG